MCENYPQKTFFSIVFVNRTATLLNLSHLEVLCFNSTDWSSVRFETCWHALTFG